MNGTWESFETTSKDLTFSIMSIEEREEYQHHANVLEFIFHKIIKITPTPRGNICLSTHTGSTELQVDRARKQ